MKQEGLRLMTPDEYLTKLKGEGYDYFLHNESIYQYEQGKYFRVFGPGVKLILTEDIKKFEAEEFPLDYLSIIGLTHDFVAFMVAEKEEIIMLDEHNVPIAQYGRKHPNYPSAYLNRNGAPKIHNMLVRFSAPGYRYETEGFMLGDEVERKRSRFHKIFHNGNFFYPGYETQLSKIHYVASFDYYTGSEYFKETMTFEDHFEEYKEIRASGSVNEQLHAVFAKMKEMLANDKDLRSYEMPFKEVVIAKQIQPMYKDDRVRYETMVNIDRIMLAQEKSDINVNTGQYFEAGTMFMDIVDDQDKAYSIDVIRTIAAEYGIVLNHVVDFEEYAQLRLKISVETGYSGPHVVQSTVTIPSDEKERPLGLFYRSKTRNYRTLEDYPSAFDAWSVEPPLRTFSVPERYEEHLPF